jgi:hypothetical protein
MFTPNVGKVERIIRLILSISGFSWVAYQDSFGIAAFCVTVACFCLGYNALAGRCYGWHWLGINTCSIEEKKNQEL